LASVSAACEASRAKIIELLGASSKAVDNIIESLRRKGWLERASWGKYLLIPPDQDPEPLGNSNLLAQASLIAEPYYIGYGTLIRRLVVLKLWQARDIFDPALLMQKFEDGRDFDWEDLRQLLNRAVVIDREKITADCVKGYGFLAELTEHERAVANDRYQREQVTVVRLRVEL
jgi:biotin operon repressor